MFFTSFWRLVFDGVAWNRYDTPTASGRGHSNDSDREPGQKVHNYTSNHLIASKCFSRVFGCCFDRGVWNRYDWPTASGWGHSTDNATEPGQKVHNYRSDRWITLKCFSRVSGGYFSMELRGIRKTCRRRPVGAIRTTAIENRVKRSITIDPTVGSR